MDTGQISAVVVSLCTLLVSAHLVAHVFDCLKQPRLIGEILAGVLVGPFVLGRVAPSCSQALLGGTGEVKTAVSLTLGLFYWLGLLLLMFVAGTEVRRVLSRENRRPTAWLLGLGTPLPFAIALGVGSFLPLERLAGPSGHRGSVLLVLAIAVAVTSIPILARMFHDLGILQTRFASLVLGAAILEDIVLWAVLAVATVSSDSVAQNAAVTSIVSTHVGVTIAYLGLDLFLCPWLLQRLSTARWSLVRVLPPNGYVIVVLLAYTALAAALGVNLVFAAFLAGFGLVGGMGGTQRGRFAEPIEAVRHVAFGAFVPILFAIVGTRLELGREFSLPMLLAFLVGSSLLCLGSISLAASLAGFRGLEIVNLAVASNARGGPGIVLATVAYDAGIINGAFFTTLVLTAVVTSQLAGAWLGMVVRRGWALLRDD